MYLNMEYVVKYAKECGCDLEWLCKMRFKGHIIMRVEFLDLLLGYILVIRVLCIIMAPQNIKL